MLPVLVVVPSRNDDRSEDRDDAEALRGSRRVGSKYDEPITCSDCCIGELTVALLTPAFIDEEMSLGTLGLFELLFPVPTQFSK